MGFREESREALSSAKGRRTWGKPVGKEIKDHPARKGGKHRLATAYWVPVILRKVEKTGMKLVIYNTMGE